MTRIVTVTEAILGSGALWYTFHGSDMIIIIQRWKAVKRVEARFEATSAG